MLSSEGGGVLVSCGCCNQVPQTGWLKTRELHSLTVPEARSLNQGFSRSLLLIKVCMVFWGYHFFFFFFATLRGLWELCSPTRD